MFKFDVGLFKRWNPTAASTQFFVTLQKACKNQEHLRNRTWPAGTVLLENFGAEPLTVQLNGSNRNNLVSLLETLVTQTMMHRIPKFWKENCPERAKKRGTQFFHTSVKSGMMTGERAGRYPSDGLQFFSNWVLTNYSIGFIISNCVRFSVGIVAQRVTDFW